MAICLEFLLGAAMGAGGRVQVPVESGMGLTALGHVLYCLPDFSKVTFHIGHLRYLLKFTSCMSSTWG